MTNAELKTITTIAYWGIAENTNKKLQLWEIRWIARPLCTVCAMKESVRNPSAFPESALVPNAIRQSADWLLSSRRPTPRHGRRSGLSSALYPSESVKTLRSPESRSGTDSISVTEIDSFLAFYEFDVFTRNLENIKLVQSPKMEYPFGLMLWCCQRGRKEVEQMVWNFLYNPVLQWERLLQKPHIADRIWKGKRVKGMKIEKLMPRKEWNSSDARGRSSIACLIHKFMQSVDGVPLLQHFFLKLASNPSNCFNKNILRAKSALDRQQRRLYFQSTLQDVKNDLTPRAHCHFAFQERSSINKTLRILSQHGRYSLTRFSGPATQSRPNSLWS